MAHSSSKQFKPCLRLCLLLPLVGLGALIALPAPAQTVYTVPTASPYPNGYYPPQNQRRTRRRARTTTPTNPYTQARNIQAQRAAAAARAAPRNAARGKRPQGPPLWPVDVTESFNTAPAVGANGLLYFGSWNHQVTAFDQKTGTVRWKFRAGDSINASPTLGPDGTVYVTSRDRNVYALDKATGAKKWQFDAGSPLGTRPTVSPSGLVYVGTSGKQVVALDAKTGAKRWQQATQFAAASPTLGLHGTLYVSAGPLYALDSATGTIKWKKDLHTLPNQAPTVGPAGTVYVGTAEAEVLALDGATGETQWRFPTGDSLDYPIVRGPDDTLYVSARKLYALRTNGQVRWERAGAGSAWSAPAIAPNGLLYAGYNNSTVYALDAATGAAKWQFATNDGLLCFPALGMDATVYFQCEGDSKVYALNRQTGQPRWSAALDPLPAVKPTRAGATPRG